MADDIVQKIRIEVEGADTVASAYEKAGKAAETAADQLQKAGSSGGDGFDKTAQAAEAVAESLSKLGSAVEQAAASLSRLTVPTEAFTAASASIEALGNTAQESFGTAAEAVGRFAQSAQGLDQVGAAIQSVAQSAAAGAQGFQSVGQSVGQVSQSFAQAGQSAQAAGQGISSVGQAGTQAAQGMSAAGTAGQSSAAGLQSFAEAAGKAGQAGAGLGTISSDGLTKAGDAGKTATGSVAGLAEAAGKAADALNKIGEAGSAAGKGVGEIGKGAKEAAAGAEGIRGTFEAVAQTVGNAYGALKSFVGGIKDVARTADDIKNIPKDLQKIAEAAQAVTSGFGTAGNKISDLFGKLAGALGTVSTGAKTAAESVAKVAPAAEAVATGVARIAPAAIAAATGIGTVGTASTGAAVGVAAVGTASAGAAVPVAAVGVASGGAAVGLGALGISLAGVAAAAGAFVVAFGPVLLTIGAVVVAIGLLVAAFSSAKTALSSVGEGDQKTGLSSLAEGIKNATAALDEFTSKANAQNLQAFKDGLSGLTQWFTNLTEKVAPAAAALRRLSEETGLSVEDIQKAQHAFEQYGVSAEKTGTIIKAVTTKIADAHDSLKAGLADAADKITEATNRALQAEKALLEAQINRQKATGEVRPDDRVNAAQRVLEITKEIEKTEAALADRRRGRALDTAEQDRLKAIANDARVLLEVMRQLDQPKKINIEFDPQATIEAKFNAIRARLDELSDDGRARLEALANILRNLPRADAIEVGLKFNLTEEQVDLIQRGANAIQALGDAKPQIDQSTVQALDDLGQASQRLQLRVQQLMDLFGLGGGSATRWAAEIKTAAKSFAADAVEGIITFVERTKLAFNSLPGAFQEVTNRISALWNEMCSAMAEALAKVAEQIPLLGKGAADALRAAADELRKSADDARKTADDVAKKRDAEFAKQGEREKAREQENERRKGGEGETIRQRDIKPEGPQEPKPPKEPTRPVTVLRSGKEPETFQARDTSPEAEARFREQQEQFAKDKAAFDKAQAERAARNAERAARDAERDARSRSGEKPEKPEEPAPLKEPKPPKEPATPITVLRSGKEPQTFQARDTSPEAAERLREQQAQFEKDKAAFDKAQAERAATQDERAAQAERTAQDKAKEIAKTPEPTMLDNTIREFKSIFEGLGKGVDAFKELIGIKPAKAEEEPRRPAEEGPPRSEAERLPAPSAETPLPIDTQPLVTALGTLTTSLGALAALDLSTLASSLGTLAGLDLRMLASSLGALAGLDLSTFAANLAALAVVDLSTLATNLAALAVVDLSTLASSLDDLARLDLSTLASSLGALAELDLSTLASGLGALAELDLSTLASGLGALAQLDLSTLAASLDAVTQALSNLKTALEGFGTSLTNLTTQSDGAATALAGLAEAAAQAAAALANVQAPPAQPTPQAPSGGGHSGSGGGGGGGGGGDGISVAAAQAQYLGLVPIPGLPLAEGGRVRGPGGPTSDSIPARLSNGEFVMSAAATQYWGARFFDALNEMNLPGFARGGRVPGGSIFRRPGRRRLRTNMANVQTVGFGSSPGGEIKQKPKSGGGDKEDSEKEPQEEIPDKPIKGSADEWLEKKKKEYDEWLTGLVGDGRMMAELERAQWWDQILLEFGRWKEAEKIFGVGDPRLSTQGFMPPSDAPVKPFNEDKFLADRGATAKKTGPMQSVSGLGVTVSSTELSFQEIMWLWERKVRDVSPTDMRPIGDAMASGGLAGGVISGPGGPTSDSILARLSNGEFVLSARAVRHWGVDFLTAINKLKMPGFSLGGVAGLLSPTLPRFETGGMVDAGSGSSPQPLGSVDLRTDFGTVNVLASKDTAAHLQRLAVQKRMTATGRKPGFVS